MAPIHQPPDALAAPRFTGPRTFARLPHLQTLEDVDCAVFGMPWDGGTTFRSGARFGPEAIRSASGMIRTYDPVTLAELRTVASVRGPLGLVHLDSHTLSRARGQRATAS